MNGTAFKARYVLPALYLVAASGAWVDFMRLPPDGLASIGLMIVVFPIALLDLCLRPEGHAEESTLIPNKWGYYADYSVFFWVGVFIMSVALYGVGRLIDRYIFVK